MKAPAFGVGFLWEWQFELWIGDAAARSAQNGWRKQKASLRGSAEIVKKWRSLRPAEADTGRYPTTYAG